MRLTSTFIHLDKIGYIKERQLWEKGILSWEDFPFDVQRDLFSKQKKSVLTESTLAYKQANADYFSSSLKPADQYRVALTG